MNIQSEQIRKEIKDLMNELSASYTRAEGERDFVKEAIKNLADKHELDKKILKKMSRVFHKSNFHTLSQENEDFEAMYETVLGAQEQD